MRMRSYILFLGLIGLLVTFIVPSSGGATRAEEALLADGKAWDTILTPASFKAPNNLKSVDNLYVTMTSRMLNPKVRIVSRIVNQGLRPKIIKAGADRVVSPDAIGALRMASIMIRPTVVDFLDSMLKSGFSQYRIHQITISKDSPAVGKTIAESGLKDKFGLLILGTRRPDNDIDLNPHPTFVLKEGMTLIVMGKADEISRAKSLY